MRALLQVLPVQVVAKELASGLGCWGGSSISEDVLGASRAHPDGNGALQGDREPTQPRRMGAGKMPEDGAGGMWGGHMPDQGAVPTSGLRASGLSPDPAVGCPGPAQTLRGCPGLKLPESPVCPGRGGQSRRNPACLPSTESSQSSRSQVEPGPQGWRVAGSGTGRKGA